METKQERTCKTEGGICYPASDYACVPDATKPSTWQLRMSQGRPGNITKSQLGRAAAAFSSGGFRGNRVQLKCSTDATKGKIRGKYRSLGVKAEDMPGSVKEKEPNWLNWLADKVKEAIDEALAKGKEEKPQAQQQEPLNYIWKEGGQYHWLGAYTNNFRDNDNPPEIISSEAHKEFDQAVNSGQWPMPEVWLWHYPYKVGQTHYHVYDEKSGFCIAGGTFDKDKGWAAEGIIKRDWKGMSHGMPRKEVGRRDEDKSIITRRRTREITFLPTKAAANNLVFHFISKESNGMSEETKEIPAHKREEFIEAFGEERVQQMEVEVANRSKQAHEQGTESKEQTSEQPEAAPAQTQPDDVVEAIRALTTAVAQVTEQVKGFDDRLKELEQTDAQKIARATQAIPEASLASYVKSNLFSAANRVEDKGKGPKETENKQDGSSGLFWEEQGWTKPQGVR